MNRRFESCTMSILQFPPRRCTRWLIAIPLLYLGLRLIPQPFQGKLHNHTKKVTTILAWQSPASVNLSLSAILGDSPLRHPIIIKTCSVPCMLVRNPSYFSSVDAVVFEPVYSFWPFLGEEFMASLPRQRSPNQPYIFLGFESPLSTYNTERFPAPKGFFNHTMSYRTDSTIYVPYYKVTRATKRRRNYMPKMHKKTNSAAWMVSHCNAPSDRDILAEELRSYMDVTIYGNCTNNPPPCELFHNDSCYPSLGKIHKFYLSFENSLCEDYVTEKFFDALRTDMIPIVYGQANYSLLGPPKSFIDVRDFPTVRDLATYLKRLHQNDTEYLEYFKWKQNWEVSVSSGWEDPFCILCQKLTSGNLAKKKSVIEDAGSWWMRAKDGRSPACKPPPSKFF